MPKLVIGWLVMKTTAETSIRARFQGWLGGDDEPLAKTSVNAHFRVCWSCQLAALRRVDRVFRAEFESRSNPSTHGWGTGLGWIQMSNLYPNPRLTRTLTRGFPIPVMIPTHGCVTPVP